MAGIQQGINQLFTTAGFMVGLSPELRAAAEKRTKIGELTRKAATVSEAGKVVAEDVSSKIGTPEFLKTAEPSLAIAKEKVAAAEELFKIDPTKERYEKASRLRDELNSMEEIMSKLKGKGMGQVKQNTAFTDLIDTLRKEGY